MHDTVLEQTFEHSPLQDPAAQIRLLEITAIDDSEGKSTPHCQVTAHYLDQLPDYFAISYTWGSPDDTCLIYVNERPLVVRQNCRDVLQQSWRNNFRKGLWVDAICINQLDDDEKSHQVAMMGAIYKQAKQVNICLGPAADNSDALFDCISHHARWVNDVLRQHGKDKQETISRVSFSVILQKLRTWEWFARVQPEDMSAAIKALRHLSERLYFTRLWIIQELFLAQQAVLFCGDASISFRAFYRFYDDLEKFLRDIQLGHREAGIYHSVRMDTPSWDFITLLNSHDDWGEQTLLDLMVNFTESQCFDPRDRVYGLLAMVDWQAKVPIRPDYNKTPWEVALSVAEYMCSTSADGKSLKDREEDNEAVSYPVWSVSEALVAIGISSDTIELTHLLERRISRMSVPSTPDHDSPRIEVAADGYCQLYDDPAKPGAFLACVAKHNPHIGSSRGLDDMHVKEAYELATEQDHPRCSAVSSADGMYAVIGPQARAGDYLLSFRTNGIIHGVVARASTKPQSQDRRFMIVATAIFDPKASICPVGLACTCLDDHKAVHSCLCGMPAEQHAPAGTAMSVHFSPEDFLVFALQDQRQDGPYAKAVPDLVVRRLGIPITKPGDQWSSYVQEQAITSDSEAH